MSTHYAFTVNGTDFKGYVSKVGYQTNLKPVEGNRITTINGIDHVSILRYRATLTVTLNPMTDAQFQTFCAALRLQNPCSVVFHCLQTNADMETLMTVDGMESAFELKNVNRTVLSGLTLTFNEL